jgi:hypothetical protein
MVIRYRWHGELAEAPMIGGYLLSTAKNPRGGYLITRVDNRGRRGVRCRGRQARRRIPILFDDHYLLVLECERVSVEATRAGPTWSIAWDKRRRRNTSNAI